MIPHHLPIFLLLSLLLPTLSHAIQHSGYVNVNKQYDANLFYLITESQNDPQTDPVILWLQGGPGCSSLFGAFIENGPSMINKDGSFSKNPYSWNTNATVIYIDSPVGTGYSYVSDSMGYATDEKTISAELYTVLYTVLFDLYPSLGKLPFYIFGESYAGKYLPWLGYTILEKNLNADREILLQGVGIGNGWVNPYVQTGSYATFLLENGRINKLEAAAVYPLYEAYKGLIDIHAYTAADIIGNDILGILTELGGIGDVYDIRKKSDPTDPLNDVLTKWLNDPSVRKGFNVGDVTWEGCSNAPFFALMSDEEQSSNFLIPKILEKIPVLLYNGNCDLICNYMGTAEYVKIMDWPYQQAFNNAMNNTWTVDGAQAGYYKSAYNLTLLIVENAGHMVPYDQPKNSHDLLYRFMNKGF
eukprot:TRINITY_DN341_c0_g1_i1.p1 TRINITY_DN341_c0_g1~~TRINITY_DN341_c0_g1_i1.p1  ORF type:complete len:425 (+),score=75.17 TRINITY_DN341_c0_g1_i1:33-1277(+)